MLNSQAFFLYKGLVVEVNFQVKSSTRNKVVKQISKCFVISLLFVALTNLLLISTICDVDSYKLLARYCFGKIGHTLAVVLVLTWFLYQFRHEVKDLLVSFVFYSLLLTPLYIIAQSTFFSDKSLIAYMIGLTEHNNVAILISIFLMLITSSSALFKSKLIKYGLRIITAILWIAVLLVPLLFIAYYFSLGAVFSDGAVVAICQTNLREAYEFVLGQGLSGFIAVLAILVSVLTVLVKILITEQKLFVVSRNIKLATLVLLFLSSLFITNSRESISFLLFQTIFKTVDQFIALNHSFKDRAEFFNTLKVSEQGNNGLYVFVVGESHCRSKISAWGWDKDNSPWMKAQRSNDAFVFMNKGFSNYVLTVQALGRALTACNQFSNLSLVQSPTIVEVLKLAGYKTAWLSNQPKVGFYDSPQTLIALQSDYSIWSDSILGENDSDYSKDGILIKLFKDYLLDYKDDSKSEKTIVFIHLHGSHYIYKERYPKEFAKWDDSDIDNAYSNSILYTDYVLKELYTLVKDREDFKAMFFMSDHGEDKDRVHNPDLFKWPMAQIPIWFAFSDSYQKEHADTVKTLKEHADTPFTNDMMFDTVCGVLGVKDMPYYEPKNDISSDKYEVSLEEGDRQLTILDGKYKVKDAPDFKNEN